jgi:hypothetical protein
VVRHASAIPAGSVVVEIEPDQYSPTVFRAFVDEMLARPRSALESIGAAEALREIRAGAEIVTATRRGMALLRLLPQDADYGVPEHFYAQVLALRSW